MRANAIGHNNEATNNDTNAIGSSNTAAAFQSNAMGSSNNAGGIGNNAIGHANKTLSSYTTAVGYSNEATATESSAFGLEMKHQVYTVMCLVLVVLHRQKTAADLDATAKPAMQVQLHWVITPKPTEPIVFP